jgi:hypothetical protein
MTRSECKNDIYVLGHFHDQHGDSKLLSGFPWSVGMEVKAFMNKPPNSSLWYT